MEILNVENLTFSYPNSTSPVLNNISFSVNSGEFVVLCGSTGSGKSTLLKNLKKDPILPTLYLFFKTHFHYIIKKMNNSLIFLFFQFYFNDF